MSITVTPENTAPVADDEPLTTAEDTTGNVNVLAGDTDIDGDSLERHDARADGGARDRLLLGRRSLRVHAERGLQRRRLLLVHGLRRARRIRRRARDGHRHRRERPAGRGRRLAHGAPRTETARSTSSPTTPTMDGGALSVTGSTNGAHGTVSCAERRDLHVHAGRRLQRRRHVHLHGLRRERRHGHRLGRGHRDAGERRAGRRRRSPDDDRGHAGRRRRPRRATSTSTATRSSSRARAIRSTAPSLRAGADVCTYTPDARLPRRRQLHVHGRRRPRRPTRGSSPSRSRSPTSPRPAGTSSPRRRRSGRRSGSSS